MKRLLCALLTIALLISCLPAALAVGNQEATLSILATRHVEGSFTDINDLWWFKYLKHYLAGEGWDVTFELEQTLEPEERISLLLATDDLPDVLWGGTLMTNVNQVIYGAGEGMLMDWTPYFNAETMPNAYGKLAEYAGVFTLPNGAIYSMPRLSGRVLHLAGLVSHHPLLREHQVAGAVQSRDAHHAGRLHRYAARLQGRDLGERRDLAGVLDRQLHRGRDLERAGLLRLQ